MIRRARLAVAAVVLVGLVGLAGGAGCSVETRSDPFRCPPAECTDGRTCVDGWCVVAGSDVDAPLGGDGPTIDADLGVCPDACDSCTGATCVIDCSADDACGGAVVCPPDWSCEVTCGVRACGGVVNCGAATACTITCGALESCGGAITCGDGPCTVACTGETSCTGGLDCRSACACDTDCSGAGSCVPEPRCHQASQCRDAPECRSTGPSVCNQC